MFKYLLQRLLILTIAMTGFTASAQEYDPTVWGVIPTVVHRPDGTVLCAIDYRTDYAGDERNCVLSYGVLTINTLNIGYDDITHVSGNTSRLKSILTRTKRPKVIVRIPSQCGDAKFVDQIETKLSDLGLTVIDHHLADGTKNTNEIRKASGADILLDVSWLKFSDPDMFAPIDQSVTNVELNFGPAEPNYDLIPSEKEYQKRIKKGRHKTKYEPMKIGDVMSEISGLKLYKDKVINQVVDELHNSQTISKNKNVVSCIFKFVDLTDGSLIASYHLGQQNFDQTAERNVKFWFREDGIAYSKMANHEFGGYGYNIASNYTFYTPYTMEYGGANKQITAPANATLNYLSFMRNTAEIPGAAQLNDFHDVKITDEQIQETGSSSSVTHGSSSGSARSYYYRGFNPTYYSGYSQSTTSTSHQATTIFKDAEYIRCSDFYGYYAPLTSKLVNELKKLTATK